MQDKKQKLSPIKQNILNFIEYLGISKREFYKLTGISRGTLESNTGITEETIAKFFATYSFVNPVWLLTGVGEMLSEIDNKDTAQSHPSRVETSVVESCQQCILRDQIIESQKETIQLLKARIADLLAERKAGSLDSNSE